MADLTQGDFEVLSLRGLMERFDALINAGMDRDLALLVDQLVANPALERWCLAERLLCPLGEGLLQRLTVLEYTY
jgi:hypothetical protein